MITWSYFQRRTTFEPEETKFQILTKAKSMTWRIYQMFLEAYDIRNHVPVVSKWSEDY